MRRFTLPILTGLLLLTAAPRPAAADDGWKEFVDCIKFTTVWCDLAREDVNNFFEYMGVEFLCALKYLYCAFEA